MHLYTAALCFISMEKSSFVQFQVFLTCNQSKIKSLPAISAASRQWEKLQLAPTKNFVAVSCQQLPFLCISKTLPPHSQKALSWVSGSVCSQSKSKSPQKPWKGEDPALMGCWDKWKEFLCSHCGFADLHANNLLTYFCRLFPCFLEMRRINVSHTC